MTVSLLARTAVSAATGAVLLGSLTVVGAAGAGSLTDSPRGVAAPKSIEGPGVAKPSGRKIG